jgi:uncharacterized protein (DUF2336 family)
MLEESTALADADLIACILRRRDGAPRLIAMRRDVTPVVG